MKQRHQPLHLLVLLCALCSGSGCGESDRPHAGAGRELPPQLLAERDPRETAELVEIGRQAFEANTCTACHSVDGTPSVGPPLKGIYKQQVQLADGQTVQRDAEYLYRAIHEPRAQTVAGHLPQLMPAYEHLDAQTLVALVEYLKSLPPPAPGPGPAETNAPPGEAPRR